MSQQCDWREIQLGELIEYLEPGVSVSGEDRVAEPGESGVLKVSAITFNGFAASENKAIVDEPGRLGPAVSQGDILVTRANTKELVGAAAVAEDDYPHLHLPDKIWKVHLRARDDTTRRWLPHALNSPGVRAQLRIAATGSSGSMKNISQHAYLKIRVHLPPRNERGRIAEVAAHWDRATRTTRELIAAKSRFRAGLMEELLTGKRTLPGFSGPWRLIRLGEVFVNREEAARGDLPLLSITANEGIVHRESLERRDTSKSDKAAYLRVCPGDIGYNTMRMWQGVSAYSELEGIVSPAYTVVTPKAVVDGRFMALMFKFPPVVHLFRRYSQGLVDDTLSLKFTAFAKIPMSIPTIPEQQAIQRTFALIDKEIQLLSDLMQAYVCQKRGLMEALLTGKRSLPVEASA